MTPSLTEAQKRAEAMGLTGARAPLEEAHRTDPVQLTRACLLLPAGAIALWLSVLSLWALCAALPLLLGWAANAGPMRRYFIAFSPRNALPRNLPAFARWAALYSGVMLTMIVLPPSWPPELRGGTWIALASGSILFPQTKALLRAHRVWS
ncbi:MAG: hypothetical protein AAFY97_02965 [Pseudomonadota bacterium]